MIQITEVIMIALFIEAVVNAIKPIWTGENKLGVTEYVSMGLGVLLAVTCKINMLTYVVEITFPFPEWVKYIFYALTGIAIGRGTNFLYDLWNKLKEWQSGQTANGFDTPEDAETVDLEITHWSLEQLRDFCELNGVDAADCATRDDYISAIESAFFKGKEPPEAGDAE